MKKYSPEEVQASFSFSVPIQVRLSDIDGYMHVNNGIYFNYLEHARAMYLYQACGWDVMDIGTVVANIQINYRKPIHAEDSPIVFVTCTEIGRSSFVLEQVIMGKDKEGNQVVFAESTTTMVAVDMKTMRPVPVPEAYAAKLRSS
ncbi:acyl-CoA thioesterase [Mariniradius saccharolyticus]|nr:thioesterase family protein [Mariniradius saccharolyticus]